MAPERPALTDRGGVADEQSLIEAARTDPARFGELYERNFDRVYAFIVRRVRDRDEAQDLTAEVFHHALAGLDRFEWRGAPFVAWLYRIAANAVADRARRLAREGGTMPQLVARTEDPADMEHQARVFRTVAQLPVPQRRVLEMRFVEQKSIREIAQELGRSEGAVKQLQFRAMENLRARVGEQHG